MAALPRFQRLRPLRRFRWLRRASRFGRRGAPAAWALAASLVVGPAACHARAPCDGVACASACPRDAEPDATGRCTCMAGTILVLGACVPPAVGDAYCGAAARASTFGCVLRTCASEELLDAVTGACVPAAGRSDEPSPAVACADGGVPAMAAGRSVCVSGAASCPRGTRRDGTACVRPASCPPGTLAQRSEAPKAREAHEDDPTAAARAGAPSGTGPRAGDTCRPVVTLGVREGIHRVDVGAWVGIVFGVDGGEGTEDLCSPLALHVDAFGLPEAASATSTRVDVRIVVVAPDEDLTRVHARVDARVSTEAGDLPLSPEAEALVERSVSTLLEPLRSLGGEASTAAVKLGVSCRMRSL